MTSPADGGGADGTSLADARRFALALPETTEEPHFDMTSFRVRGKIFATVPARGAHLHVFVGEAELQAAASELPRTCEPLVWGQRVRGLRVRLALAPRDLVCELLAEAWRRKAPARLRADLDRRNADQRDQGP